MSYVHILDSAKRLRLTWDNVSVNENCQIQWPAPIHCIDVVTRLVDEARTQRTDLEEEGKKRNPFCIVVVSSML